MKIGIDARLYGTKHRGLGRYVQKLVDGVVKADTNNQYVLFFTKDNINEFKLQAKNVKKVEMNARWYSLKEQSLVPKVIKKEKLDLMHFPHFNVPLIFNQKYIVTIHDLIIDHFPDSRATNLPKWQYKIKLSVYKKILAHAVKKAKKIVVPSKFVKIDLMSLYQIPKEKIEVTYEGYFLEEGHEPSDIARFKIDKPFLLGVGAAYPHKNLERLIRVFKQINKSSKYQLVLVGENDKFYQRLKDKVNDKNIIFTGFVSEGELKNLYQKAVLYVFASLYEGFGLPPIEAQAHKLPVVSSNRSSMPEVLSDSVVYFNPEDESEMTKKIISVLNNQNLREDLVKKGLKNIQRFSWDKMVKETIKLYK